MIMLKFVSHLHFQLRKLTQAQKRQLSFKQKEYLYKIIKMPKTIILGIILIVLTNSVWVNETFNTSDANVQWTPIIQARTEDKQLPAQYYLCGFQFLQQKWGKSLYNCDCRRRIILRWRCNWCWNTFYSRTSGFKGIFCKYTNWNDQITNTYVTDSPNAAGWRNIVMCPKNQYANGFSAKYGFAFDQKLGFNGLQLKCSKNTLNESSFVEDSQPTWKTPFHNPRIGNFISSYRIMFSKKERLWGFSVNYEGMPLISKVQLQYNLILDYAGTPVVIDSQEVINCGGQPSQKTVGFTKKHETSGTWTTTNSYTQGVQMRIDIGVKPPMLNGFQFSGGGSITMYSSSTQSFSFEKQVRTTYQSNQNIIVVVSAGKAITVNSLIQEQIADVPYTAILTFVNRYTGAFITKYNVTGIWKGVMASATRTQIIERAAECGGNLRT